MNTIPVFWKDKFNGKAVTINAADFNSEIHRHKADGPWPTADAEVEAEAETEVKPKAAKHKK